MTTASTDNNDNIRVMNKPIPLTIFFPKASRISAGCMGLGQEGEDTAAVTHAHHMIDAALTAGINFFDHADIYSHGRAEMVFGHVLKERPSLRSQILIQSKCGIQRPGEQWVGRYNWSKEWILESVDNILRRLQVDHIDLLLLHRPDPLMEGEEVAEALSKIQRAGKVAHFGCSNMSSHQIKYLQGFVEQPLIVNQLQMSLSHTAWLDNGVEVNHESDRHINFPHGTIEYCRTHNIQLQAWGPLSKGIFTGADISNQPQWVHETANYVQHLANEHDTTPEAIVLAWIMRHPARIQPVIGTTNPQRILACQHADQIELTREQWYQLYVTARGGVRVP